MLDDVQRVLDTLAARRLTLAIAEGDTGGLLLAWLTARPGSSAVVLGGVVAYHDDLKRHLLGVESDLLRRHGAVSAEAVEAMASGVRRLVGAGGGGATTGIAGTAGATPRPPGRLAVSAGVRAGQALVGGAAWARQRAAQREATP